MKKMRGEQTEKAYYYDDRITSQRKYPEGLKSEQCNGDGKRNSSIL